MRNSLRLASALLLVLSTVTLTACGGPEEAPTEAPAPAAVAPLQLYVMNCGELKLHDVTPFNLSAEEAGTDELFVPCYLIDHPDGQLIWDLGLPLALRGEDVPTDGATVTLLRSAAEQLADIDLTPADIEYVAFSHLHFDHCGQAADFANAHHLIQRAEHEAGFVDDPQVPAFQRELYAPLETSETTLLDGDHDVFGDGRVVIKSAPGHTPGHQMLFVDLEETGPILLSGDLYHFPANRELRRPPHFNWDAEQTLATMETMEQFLTETGATLWIEHNAELAASLKKLPDSYR